MATARVNPRRRLRRRTDTGRYRMKNTGYITRSLSEKQFWQKGVRAVMLSTHNLYASGEGYVWVIFSTATEGGV